jgi:outer membrane lipoprotein-sorting protein
LNLRWWRRTSTCPQILNILLIVAFAGLAGCATTTIQPIPTEAPTGPWEAGQLRDALAQRREKFQSLRALANVDYSGPDGKNGFQEAVLIQRPDRLRLETLSMLGAILVVTVNNKEIIGYHPREGVYVRGQASKANLQKYTQIPLELDEMTALLLGLPPADTKTPSELNGNSLIFSSSKRKDVVSFESKEAVPTKWQRMDGSGRVELSASFADYIQTPAGLFPSKILMESPQQKKRLEIRYREPELNVSIANDLFSQQKPVNVKEYPIEALGK